ncbi:MAG: branched-chain amino acid ABC transporter ATP-binding protein/permease [Halofilum sp. (in: g-proteobacteria)]|nr:branched-chain amino acid ABC transporter ATP-binding protein/permease [Halofilum sp. (in: g-proteobacteria)]
MNAIAGRVVLYGAILLFGIAGPYVFPAYTQQMASLWLFIVFALSWDVCGGQMGYNSFGNVFFLGLGMYTCAVTQVGLVYEVSEYTSARGGSAEFAFTSGEWLTGLLLGLPLGAVVAVLGAVVFGMFILAMRGHYFAICTLGLGIAAGELAAGWDWIGAGSGMTTPMSPSALGDTNVLLYYLAFVLAVIAFVFFRWLYSTRFGLAINAIRDGEEKAEAMGLRTTRDQGHGLGDRGRVPRRCRGHLRQPQDLHRPDRRGFLRCNVRRLDDPHGHPRRQGHAVGAGDRGGDLPGDEGAVLDLPARLAAGGPRAADRADRGVLPDRDPRVPARALPPALRPRRGRGGGRGRGGEMSAMLEVSGVTKAFGGVVANDDISLQVAQGSIVGLIGPNGSGKTTLFSSIVGYHPVDSGSIRFEGEELSRLRVPEVARRGLLRTFQQTRIYGEMTCTENMVISADLRKAGVLELFRAQPRDVEQRAGELLEFVGLYEKRRERAGSLSFGQQKLLELAMALMNDPRMLMLDEPTAGINPTLINGLIDRLTRANTELGVTLFVIEHNMRVIMNLVGHVYCLAHGQLLADGRPDEVKNDPRVLDAYLGAT